MTTDKPLKLIGRAEKVSFPELNPSSEVHARIDTGARTSSIWGDARVLPDGALEVMFFGNKQLSHVFKDYGELVVASSTGHAEKRYTIKLLVVVDGRRIRGTFTIANRSSQVYPVLVGRNVLRGKFIVDVKRGDALIGAENARIAALQKKLLED